MGFFVWVSDLKCEHGHDLEPQSHVRPDFRGYPAGAVSLDVAEDLRDQPFPCMRCLSPAVAAHGHLSGPALTDTWNKEYAATTKYRLKFVSEPKSVCEGCGGPSACGCYKVVAVEVEIAPPEALPSGT